MSAATLKSFDPYYHWLGIKTDERPLNPYQLLGIPELDRDKDRIAAAVEHRRAQLNLYRDAADSQLWESVSKQLHDATATLLDADEKAILDAGIRRQKKCISALRDFVPDSIEALDCTKCGTENNGTRRFCIECGRSLWLVCTQCEEISRADEKFCGNCGANHVEALNRALESAQALIDKARELKNAAQISEALRLLQEVLIADDPRLEDIIRAAQHERTLWLSEHRRRVEHVQDVERQALQHWDAGDRQSAVSLLTAVPESMLSSASREILSDLQSEQVETRQLEQGIKEAIEKKDFRAVGSQIDRLLELQPQHVQATKLAQKLATVFKQAAIKHHAEGDYQKALALLEQTPEIERGEAYQQMYERIVELAWLTRQIRQSPLVDQTTVGIAERLAKLAPRNQTVVDWHLQLKRRLSDSGEPVAWAKPPQHTFIGDPVSLWHGTKRLSVHPDCRERWAKHVGILPTAVGLALQGLDLADMPTNLRPQKSLLRSNISFGRRKVSTSSWGIDIGQAAIKAVKLTIDGDGPPQVEQVIVMPHAARISRHMTDQQSAEEVKASLARLAADANVTKERVVVGLSANMTFIKSLRLPPAKHKQLRDVVQFEAKQQFPLPLDDLYWDYHVSQNASDNRQSGSPTITQHRATFLAAKRELVDAKLDLCRQLNVEILQSSALALHNVLMFSLETKNSNGAIGILDVGAANSSFAVAGRDFMSFRNIPICGDSFNEAISRDSQLTTAQAEQVKCEPLRAKDLPKLFATLSPLMQSLVADVRRSIEVFQREHKQMQLEHIYLAGGGARLYGLLQQFWFGN